jgi:hypothetical protein
MRPGLSTRSGPEQTVNMVILSSPNRKSSAHRLICNTPGQAALNWKLGACIPLDFQVFDQYDTDRFAGSSALAY